MTRRHRLALASTLAVVLAGPAPAARAEEPASGSSTKEQVKSGFKETGRAIGRGATAVGHMFRDGAKETWRVTKPGREKTKEAGREVGHGAKKAGQAVGEGAKETGRKVKSAVTGGEQKSGEEQGD